MRRLRGERGQATSEYVALLALVAVVLLALAGISASGIGSGVLAGLQRGICVVAPGPCPAIVALTDDLAPCPVAKQVKEERLSETIASVKLGTSGTLSVVRGSDGSAVVTLSDGSSVGGELGAGAGLAIGERVLGAQRRLTAEVVWSTGRSWRFADTAAAERFVERYGGKATMAGQLADEVRSTCSLLCDALGWNPHAKLPPADEQHDEGGAVAALTGAFGLGGASIPLDARAGAVVGRTRTRSGPTTWYLRLDAAATAQLRLPASELSAAVAGEAVLSYTLDRDGRPLALGVQAAAEGGGRAALAGAVRRGRLRRGSGSGDDARGGVVELAATLDLTDPANREAAAGLLAALQGTGPSIASQAAALGRRIATGAQVDVRAYRQRTSARQVGAQVALGLAVGGSWGRSTKGLELVYAATRLPGLPFLTRDDCRAA